MNILLISANLIKEPEPVFPIGCAYLISALKRKNNKHKISFIDLLQVEKQTGFMQERIKDFNPGMVALSIRNIENIDYPVNESFVPRIKDIISTIRSVTAAPIVVGGGGFSVVANSFITEVGGDLGVIGEGEKILPEIAEIVEKNNGLPGDMIKKVIRSSIIEDLNSITPDRKEAGFDYYLPKTGCITIQTKRGCSFRCSYCTYPFIEGSKIRTRNPEAVASEMQKLIEDHHINEFVFVDSVFNYPENHAVQVCEAIIKMGIKASWTAYFRPVFEGKSFFNLLARAGCTGIDASAESLSEKTLTSLGKDFTPSQIEAFCKEAKKANLEVNLNLLFGAPGENNETILETIKRAEACNPRSIIAQVGIRLYPSAPITLQLQKEGIIDSNSVGLDPIFYISEKAENSIFDNLAEASRRFKGWIIPGMKIRYNPMLFKRMRKHGKKGPIWKFVQEA